MPARKPRATKVLLGTLRHEATPSRHRALVGAPVIPHGLSVLATEHWQSLCSSLSDLGLLSRTDGAAIATAALLLADRDELRLLIVREGRVYSARAANGTELRRPHPAHAMLDAVERRLLASLLQLGLSPRARLSLDTTNVSADQADGSAAPDRKYF